MSWELHTQGEGHRHLLDAAALGWEFRVQGEAHPPILDAIAKGWEFHAQPAVSRQALGERLPAVLTVLAARGKHSIKRGSASRFPTRRRVVLLGSGAGVLALGLATGGAFAYFSSSGSGTGSGSVGILGAVNLETVTGTPSSDLIPGGSADLTLTLDNTNSYPVTITAISQDGLVTVSGGSGCTSDTGTWPSGVTPGNSGVSVNTLSGLSITVGAGPGNVVVQIPGGASMTTSSDTGCQGASFDIPVTVTVQQ